MQKRRGLPRLFHIRPLLYPATFEPGAGDGVRTRDPELGKLVLYQLSYTRIARILPSFTIADKLKIISVATKCQPIFLISTRITPSTPIMMVCCLQNPITVAFLHGFVHKLGIFPTEF